MDLNLNLSSFKVSKNMLDPQVVYDVIIIGGGPAGLNAALYALRKKMFTAIITEDIGGQIAQSTSIENWLGTKHQKSDVLVNNFYEHVLEYHPVIAKNIKVVSMDINDEIKKVSCSDGNIYQAQSIIIASGKSPRKLNVPKEAELTGKGVAYCTTCDGPAFAGKKVAIVGGGNSGVEAALDMLGYANEVVIIQDIDRLSADPVLVDRVIADPRISVEYQAEVLGFEGDLVLSGIKILDKVSQEEKIIPVDGVFIEIGLVPSSGFVPESLKNPQGEIIIDAFCATNVSGVFACGDVSIVPFKQVVIAAGEGAKAALSAFSYVLNKK